MDILDPHFLNACRQEWALAYITSGQQPLSDAQWLAAYNAVETAIRKAAEQQGMTAPPSGMQYRRDIAKDV
jgi:hypothetical protein